MGPEIIIKALKIVNNGILQIDFQNTETNEQWRCFAKLEVDASTQEQSQRRGYNH
jgi:hypothetical protein